MENEDFQYNARNDGWDRKVRRQRRSSILKEINNEKENNSNISSKNRRSRRVSFADTTSIKEFLASKDANTLWNCTYEEPVGQDSSSSMEITNIVNNCALVSSNGKENNENMANNGIESNTEINTETEDIQDFLSRFLGINQPNSATDKDVNDTVEMNTTESYNPDMDITHQDLKQNTCNSLVAMELTSSVNAANKEQISSDFIDQPVVFSPKNKKIFNSKKDSKENEITNLHTSFLNCSSVSEKQTFSLNYGNLIKAQDHGYINTNENFDQDMEFTCNVKKNNYLNTQKDLTTPIFLTSKENVTKIPKSKEDFNKSLYIDVDSEHSDIREDNDHLHSLQRNPLNHERSFPKSNPCQGVSIIGEIMPNIYDTEDQVNINTDENFDQDMEFTCIVRKDHSSNTQRDLTTPTILSQSRENVTKTPKSKEEFHKSLYSNVDSEHSDIQEDNDHLHSLQRNPLNHERSFPKSNPCQGVSIIGEIMPNIYDTEDQMNIKTDENFDQDMEFTCNVRKDHSSNTQRDLTIPMILSQSRETVTKTPKSKEEFHKSLYSNLDSEHSHSDIQEDNNQLHSQQRNPINDERSFPKSNPCQGVSVIGEIMPNTYDDLCNVNQNLIHTEDQMNINTDENFDQDMEFTCNVKKDHSSNIQMTTPTIFSQSRENVTNPINDERSFPKSNPCQGVSIIGEIMPNIYDTEDQVNLNTDENFDQDMEFTCNVRKDHSSNTQRDLTIPTILSQSRETVTKTPKSKEEFHKSLYSNLDSEHSHSDIQEDNNQLHSQQRNPINDERSFPKSNPCQGVSVIGEIMPNTYDDLCNVNQNLIHTEDQMNINTDENFDQDMEFTCNVKKDHSSNTQMTTPTILLQSRENVTNPINDERSFPKSNPCQGVSIIGKIMPNIYDTEDQVNINTDENFDQDMEFTCNVRKDHSSNTQRDLTTPTILSKSRENVTKTPKSKEEFHKSVCRDVDSEHTGIQEGNKKQHSYQSNLLNNGESFPYINPCQEISGIGEVQQNLCDDLCYMNKNSKDGESITLKFEVSEYFKCDDMEITSAIPLRDENLKLNSNSLVKIDDDDDDVEITNGDAQFLYHKTSMVKVLDSHSSSFCDNELNSIKILNQSLKVLNSSPQIIKNDSIRLPDIEIAEAATSFKMFKNSLDVTDSEPTTKYTNVSNSSVQLEHDLIENSTSSVSSFLSNDPLKISDLNSTPNTCEDKKLNLTKVCEKISLPNSKNVRNSEKGKKYLKPFVHDYNSTDTVDNNLPSSTFNTKIEFNQYQNVPEESNKEIQQGIVSISKLANLSKENDSEIEQEVPIQDYAASPDNINLLTNPIMDIKQNISKDVSSNHVNISEESNIEIEKVFAVEDVSFPGNVNISSKCNMEMEQEGSYTPKYLNLLEESNIESEKVIVQDEVSSSENIYLSKSNMEIEDYLVKELPLSSKSVTISKKINVEIEPEVAVQDDDSPPNHINKSDKSCLEIQQDFKIMDDVSSHLCVNLPKEDSELIELEEVVDTITDKSESSKLLNSYCLSFHSRKRLNDSNLDEESSAKIKCKDLRNNLCYMKQENFVKNLKVQGNDNQENTIDHNNSQFPCIQSTLNKKLPLGSYYQFAQAENQQDVDNLSIHTTGSPKIICSIDTEKRTTIQKEATTETEEQSKIQITQAKIKAINSLGETEVKSLKGIQNDLAVKIEPCEVMEDILFKRGEQRDQNFTKIKKGTYSSKNEEGNYECAEDIKQFETCSEANEEQNLIIEDQFKQSKLNKSVFESPTSFMLSDEKQMIKETNCQKKQTKGDIITNIKAMVKTQFEVEDNKKKFSDSKTLKLSAKNNEISSPTIAVIDRLCPIKSVNRFPNNQGINCCEMCHCLANTFHNIWAISNKTTRKGWVEIQLQRRPLKIYVSFDIHHSHHIIMCADWSPQSKDLKETDAQFVMKTYGSIISEEIKKLIGENMCDIDEPLKNIFQVYEEALSFYKKLCVLQFRFITKFCGERIEVTLSNLKAHLIVQLSLRFKRENTNGRIELIIQPLIKMGNLRKKNIEDIIEFASRENDFLHILNCVNTLMMSIV